MQALTLASNKSLDSLACDSSVCHCDRLPSVGDAVASRRALPIRLRDLDGQSRNSVPRIPLSLLPILVQLLTQPMEISSGSSQPEIRLSKCQS